MPGLYPGRVGLVIYLAAGRRARFLATSTRSEAVSGDAFPLSALVRVLRRWCRFKGGGSSQLAISRPARKTARLFPLASYFSKPTPPPLGGGQKVSATLIHSRARLTFNVFNFNIFCSSPTPTHTMLIRCLCVLLIKFCLILSLFENPINPRGCQRHPKYRLGGY